MLNSMGTAEGFRPNGIFRLDMNLNYDCVYYDKDNPVWVFYWQTLDFKMARDILYVDSAGECSGKKPCYSSVQQAVNASNTPSTILVANGTYDEDVKIAAAKNLVLKGGYNSTYTEQSSKTILNSLETANGYIVVDGFTLQ